MFYVYILYSSSADKFYIGQSSNPWQRLEQHNVNSGNKFTGKYKDWEFKAVFEVSEDRGEAVRIERFIKKQKSRAFLMKIMDPVWQPEGELAQLVRVPHLRD